MDTKPDPLRPAIDRSWYRPLVGSLRAYFLTGLVVSAPIVITLWAAYWFVALFDLWLRPLIPLAYSSRALSPVSDPRHRPPLGARRHHADRRARRQPRRPHGPLLLGPLPRPHARGALASTRARSRYSRRSFPSRAAQLSQGGPHRMAAQGHLLAGLRRRANSMARRSASKPAGACMRSISRRRPTRPRAMSISSMWPMCASSTCPSRMREAGHLHGPRLPRSEGTSQTPSITLTREMATS